MRTELELKLQPTLPKDNVLFFACFFGFILCLAVKAKKMKPAFNLVGLLGEDVNDDASQCRQRHQHWHRGQH